MGFALRFIIGMEDMILRFTIGTAAFPADLTLRFSNGMVALFAALRPPLNNIGMADLARPSNKAPRPYPICPYPLCQRAPLNTGIPYPD